MALSDVRVPRPCGAPPLPTVAERHAVLRQPAWLERIGMQSLHANIFGCTGCWGSRRDGAQGVFSHGAPTVQAAEGSGVDVSGR